MLSRKDHTGHEYERIGDLFILSIDLRGCLCLICILDMDLQVSALSLQIFRSNLLPVQVVGELYANRTLLVSRPLIINVCAVRIPGQILAVLCECLVAFYLCDILQITLIRQFFF